MPLFPVSAKCPSSIPPQAKGSLNCGLQNGRYSNNCGETESPFTIFHYITNLWIYTYSHSRVVASSKSTFYTFSSICVQLHSTLSNIILTRPWRFLILILIRGRYLHCTYTLRTVLLLRLNKIRLFVFVQWKHGKKFQAPILSLHDTT